MSFVCFQASTHNKTTNESNRISVASLLNVARNCQDSHSCLAHVHAVGKNSFGFVHISQHTNGRTLFSLLTSQTKACELTVTDHWSNQKSSCFDPIHSSQPFSHTRRTSRSRSISSEEMVKAPAYRHRIQSSFAQSIVRKLVPDATI